MKGILIATAIILTNVLATIALAAPDATNRLPSPPAVRANNEADGAGRGIKDTQAVLRKEAPMPQLFQNGKATTMLTGYVSNYRQ
jgi:hypothetical protein